MIRMSLSKCSTVIYAFLPGILYVVTFYVLIPSNVKHLPRNDPLHIKFRMFCTTVSMALSPLPLYIVSKQLGRESMWDLMGASISLGSLSNVLYPLVLTCSLFLGPLYVMVLDVQRQSSTFEDAYTILCSNMPSESLQRFRNLVFAPISEEFVFRSCTIPILRLGGFSRFSTIALSCFSFGAAHLHHFNELRKSYSFQIALYHVSIQFLITSIFGVLSGYLFLLSGNLWGVILSHTFCNYIGPPNMEFLHISHPLYRKRYSIYFVYLLGIASFFSSFLSTSSSYILSRA